jgi:hypothetical protein
MKKKTKRIEMKRVRGGVPVRSTVKAGVQFKVDWKHECGAR